MKWTLFILDFDGTYDNENNDTIGVQPLIYLVPTNEIRQIRNYAQEAHDSFHQNTSSDACIGDYFEEWLDSNKIDYRKIGTLDLSFGERHGEYLSNEIAMEIV